MTFLLTCAQVKRQQACCFLYFVTLLSLVFYWDLRNDEYLVLKTHMKTYSVQCSFNPSQGHFYFFVLSGVLFIKTLRDGDCVVHT